MPNPPYSTSVMILREHQDGIAAELYHWAEVPEDFPLPPCAPFTQILSAVRDPADPRHVSRIAQRSQPTRTAVVQMVANFLTTNYPDTPAGTTAATAVIRMDQPFAIESDQPTKEAL